VSALNESEVECGSMAQSTYSVMCCGDERPVVRVPSSRSCSELGFQNNNFGRIDVCGASEVDGVGSCALQL
jgi:hypothetical protein